jgi:hypothetical protein
MNYRIGKWAGVGFLVAACWVLYAFVAGPSETNPSNPITTIVRLTCPITFFDTPLSIYTVLFANTATYALLGIVVEVFRRQFTRSK